ncbi:regulator of RNase E activity RraA [Streptomyces calvus]|uniref:S-adenosylmethionine: 2-demethylmenaquinone methyltransferase n=1 Tax=Streptomyces calvus TaxID=67282 RepID=UPI003511AA67
MTAGSAGCGVSGAELGGGRGEVAVRRAVAVTVVPLSVPRSACRGGGRPRVPAPVMPVAFGGVTFRPGDILHAGDDGIVLLPDRG